MRVGGHEPDLVVHRPCWKPLFTLCDFSQTSSSVRGDWDRSYGESPDLGALTPLNEGLFSYWISLSYPLADEL